MQSNEDQAPTHPHIGNHLKYQSVNTVVDDFASHRGGGANEGISGSVIQTEP
jgi:hypothetical protein